MQVKKILLALAASVALIMPMGAANAAPLEGTAPPEIASVGIKQVEKPLPTIISKSDEAKLREQFENYDVPAKQQSELIKKLRTGKSLDALNPDKKPVKTEKSEVAGQQTVIERFADGSFHASTMKSVDPSLAAASSVEGAPVATPAAAITGCKYSSGSGYVTYSTCTVSHTWSGIITISFVASYQFNSGMSSITYRGNASQQCFVATCTRPDLVLNQKTSSGSGFTNPAMVQATSTVTAGLGSWEVWLQLQVGKTSARAVHS